MHRHLFVKVPCQAVRRWLQPNTLLVRTQSTVAATTTKTSLPSMITMTHPTAPIASFNQRLLNELRHKKNRNQPRRLVKNVKEIIEEIKAQHLKFDQTTYNCLLVAYRENQNVKAVLNTLQEMEEQGVPPSIDSYHIALETLGNARHTVIMKQLKEVMVQQGIEPTAQTYHILIKGLCHADHLEEALDLFESLTQSTTEPTIELGEMTWTQLIQGHLRVHDVATAYSLLQQAEAKHVLQDAMSKMRLYMDVLRECANVDQLDMVKQCWEKAIHEQKIRPDEGVLLNTLRVAAKHGQPSLVTDVIRTLGAHGYTYKEHYFTPLMEAIFNNSHRQSDKAEQSTSKQQQHVKDLKSAFQVLDLMRELEIEPSVRTTQPILDFLRGDVNKVDEAYFVLEEMRTKDKKKIDVMAFNVVVAACAQLGDMERTIATYREAPRLGVTVNVDTCNAVLDACIATAMKGMGTILIEDMKKEKIQPNMETYTKMIELSLTQRNYEDAFLYLEEMKGYDIVPPQRCYMKLAAKLAKERDPRFHMVMEELDTFGYKVHPDRVKQMWNNGGINNNRSSSSSSSNSNNRR